MLIMSRLDTLHAREADTNERLQLFQISTTYVNQKNVVSYLSSCDEREKKSNSKPIPKKFLRHVGFCRNSRVTEFPRKTPSCGCLVCFR